ncbi:MAG: arsenite methyltransferase [Chlorobiaceae bacterium]|nr:arsenite methyltransferase [Chlorobiaceae bacterium]
MDERRVRDMVKERYASIVAQSGPSGPSQKSSCLDPRFIHSAGRLAGYSGQELKRIPDGSNLGLGCGNPVAFGAIREGDRVLDLGSGAGMDSFLAADIVGEKGLVIGVDMTPGMIDRARMNAMKGGFRNVEFRLGEIENLPVENSIIDVVISNCVINLSTDKPKVFQEAWRVMKPGGTLMVSDMVLLEELPGYLERSVEAYVRCISGAIRKEEYLEAVQQAGFDELSILGESHFPAELIAEHSLMKEIVNKMRIPMSELQRIGSTVVSLKISAKKPHQH